MPGAFEDFLDSARVMESSTPPGMVGNPLYLFNRQVAGQAALGKKSLAEYQAQEDRMRQSDKDRMQQQWQVQDRNLKLQRQAQLFPLLLQQFQGSGANGGAIDFGQVAGLLGDARALRGSTFSDGAIGRSDLGRELSGLQGLSSLDSNGMRAMRDMGQQNIQGSYLSALRDMRSSTSDRSISPQSAAAMRSDLLKQRIRSQKDLQQGMLANEAQRRQAVLGLMGQLRSGMDSTNINAALQERLNRLGNPELAAQMNMEAQNANYNARQGQIQQLLGLIGGF